MEFPIWDQEETKTKKNPENPEKPEFSGSDFELLKFRKLITESTMRYEFLVL